MERRTSRESVDPSASSSCAPLATAASRSRASARSSSPVSWLVPPKETCWWSMVKCRPSAALRGVLGGLVGHEPGDRLGDQPLQRGDADAVRERRHLGVHERRCLRGQAERRLRDPAGPPGLQVTGLHPGPAPGEPVLQLHRRRDQCPAAVGGAADGEGELGDAELRDQWCAFAGEGEAGVSAGGDPGGCLVDRLRWVLLGPGHRGDHQVGSAPGWLRPGLAGEHQHVTAESRSPRSMLVVAVMSEFKHRAPTETGQIPLLWKGILDFLHSGPVVPVGFSAYGVWSRLTARFARCSTTCGRARLARPRARGSTAAVVSGFETLASLAPQPPGLRFFSGLAAALTRASKRRWSRPASGCHWTPRQKRVPSASIASREPSVARAVAT